jgi:hypothetical protein
MSTYKGTHKIAVTIFRDQYAMKKDVRQWTLPEMRDEFLNTSAATKKKLPWVKMADFGTNAAKSGSLRHDANVLSVEGLRTGLQRRPHVSRRGSRKATGTQHLCSGLYLAVKYQDQIQVANSGTVFSHASAAGAQAFCHAYQWRVW